MWGFCVCLCFVLHYYGPFYFCNRLEEVENAADLLLLSYRCLVHVNVLWLFITVRWVGLQCMIVVSPGHTHLLYISRPCQCSSDIAPIKFSSGGSD